MIGNKHCRFLFDLRNEDTDGKPTRDRVNSVYSVEEHGKIGKTFNCTRRLGKYRAGSGKTIQDFTVTAPWKWSKWDNCSKTKSTAHVWRMHGQI